MVFFPLLASPFVANVGYPFAPTRTLIEQAYSQNTVPPTSPFLNKVAPTVGLLHSHLDKFK